MISTKKLLKLARKWQKMAAIRRKRISFPQTIASADSSSCSTSSKAEKGCFVVYSADQKRFLLPLEYLNNEIIRELLHMAEDEFGLSSKGPLTLPCEAELMEYAISLIKQQVNRDVEMALLSSIANSCSSSSFRLQQLPIYSC
ncbi:auxin-responsive protein SAUR68 [Ricinus communis]|uniref:Calmodulin binding protein, putative n=1 Tax=Ricinus communis TaxID=3988 RepID=B9S9L4_RICCO|nr:auxin-responsive protein SAUR68 [Ricinus communis]EEF39770.1 calmodulin binding protein, putative [Ricinus communis]|eukprot:XP_002522683.3 auxin-responsive protein SAUR68 [Ricinus communis]